VKGLPTTNLLDTYNDERRPIGLDLVTTTDAAFTFVSGGGVMSRIFRGLVAPVVAPIVTRYAFVRRIGAMRLSQLGIGYRKTSIRSADHDRPRFTARLRAGDRFPDLDVPGDEPSLHRRLDPVRLTLLVVGGPTLPADSRWPIVELQTQTTNERALLGMRAGTATAYYLIRPDGHLAGRATTLAALTVPPPLA
jgi:hypothetical protein